MNVIIFKINLILLLFFLQISFCGTAQTISKYEVCDAIAKVSETKIEKIVLRKFIRNNQTFYLCVDPNTLFSKIYESDKLTIAEQKWSEIKEHFKTSAYIKALQNAELQCYTIQDAGIKHIIRCQNGLVLTVDLCPSRNSIRKSLFTLTVNQFKTGDVAVPVAISLSGKWMVEHKTELEWLKSLVAKNDLKITWINHSYNHRTSAKLPLSKNFLLEKGTDINFEVLETEKCMIENDLTPSIFFRFPGLVSDKDVFLKITGFGLIPIGSDAWLAKDQYPQPGSIILVHGNGNEPMGVRKYFHLIKLDKNFKSEKLKLIDLQDAMVEEQKCDEKNMGF